MKINTNKTTNENLHFITIRTKFDPGRRLELTMQCIQGHDQKKKMSTERKIPATPSIAPTSINPLLQLNQQGKYLTVQQDSPVTSKENNAALKLGMQMHEYPASVQC